VIFLVGLLVVHVTTGPTAVATPASRTTTPSAPPYRTTTALTTTAQPVLTATDAPTVITGGTAVASGTVFLVCRQRSTSRKGRVRRTRPGSWTCQLPALTGPHQVIVLLADAPATMTAAIPGSHGLLQLPVGVTRLVAVSVS
jgi:hypothetical protein